MAINYTTIFTKIGKLVKGFDIAATDKATYIALGDAIKSVLVDELDWNANASLPQLFGEAETDSLQQQILDSCRLYLSSLEATLNSDTSDPDDILDALIRNMNADSEAVLESTFTITDDTYVEGTDGKKIVFSDVRKDQITLAIDEPSEQIEPTAFLVACTDGYSDGNTSRDEAYLINPDNPDIGSETLTTNDNEVTDGVFANGIDDWDTTGTVTPVAAGGYYGDDYVTLVSSASISQEVGIDNDTVYNISFKAKSAGAGDISVTIRDQDANEQVVLSVTGVAATWTLYEAIFVLAENIGPTYTMTIAEEVTADVDIDDVYLQSGVEINGLTAFAIPTSSFDQRAKEYAASVAKATTGKFQNFIYKGFQRQLPSATSGAETISETLAT